MAYTPYVGESGVYTLLMPYAALITPDVIYTCRSLRTISDLTAANVDTYEVYYKPHSLSQAAYEEDVKNNVVVVGLQAGIGEWVYVPSSYIHGSPKTDGIKYSSIVLGVSLGPLPDIFNLDSLIAEYKELTLSTIGVNPEIKGVLISQPAFIETSIHEKLEEARKNKVTNNESLYTRYETLAAENKKLRENVKSLEEYIKTKL